MNWYIKESVRYQGRPMTHSSHVHLKEKQPLSLFVGSAL